MQSLDPKQYQQFYDKHFAHLKGGTPTLPEHKAREITPEEVKKLQLSENDFKIMRQNRRAKRLGDYFAAIAVDEMAIDKAENLRNGVFENNYERINTAKKYLPGHTDSELWQVGFGNARSKDNPNSAKLLANLYYKGLERIEKAKHMKGEAKEVELRKGQKLLERYKNAYPQYVDKLDSLISDVLNSKPMKVIPEKQLPLVSEALAPKTSWLKKLTGMFRHIIKF